MRVYFISICLLISGFLQAGFDTYFENRSLRVDMYHTGNFEKEIFSLNELIAEEYYSGPKKNLIPHFDYGTHKYELFDYSSGEIIFMRGWNSIFYEWQRTEDAKTAYRTYSESLVMPFPKNKVKLSISTRSRGGMWELKFETTIDPGSIYISKEKRKPASSFVVHSAGNNNSALDIVFLAEGYTQKQMKKFRRDCKRFAGYLLSCRPFSEYADRINIRAVESVSMQSGCDNPGEMRWRNTALNSSFYTLEMERYLTAPDIRTLRDYAANVPYDHIIVIVNTDEYGGGGFYNNYSILTSCHDYSDFLLIHELGHGLAGLADEYYTSDVAYQDYYSRELEPWEPNITTLVGFENKWEIMIDAGTPVPTPKTRDYANVVGVYEGGGYAAKGVYRPYIDCTMKSVSFDNFCPVCQKSIGVIMEFYCDMLR